LYAGVAHGADLSLRASEAADFTLYIGTNLKIRASKERARRPCFQGGFYLKLYFILAYPTSQAKKEASIEM